AVRQPGKGAIALRHHFLDGVREVRECPPDEVHVLGEFPVPTLGLAERPPELQVLGEQDGDQRLIELVPQGAVEPLDQREVVRVRSHCLLRLLGRATRSARCGDWFAVLPLAYSLPRRFTRAV